MTTKMTAEAREAAAAAVERYRETIDSEDAGPTSGVRWWNE